MKEKGKMIEWGMRYKAFPLAFALVLVALGIYALFNMPRNEFPEFTIRQGLVVGIYPGATSDQVENQLTTKVEEFVFGFNEVDKNKTYSYSKDGMMYLFIEVAGHVNDANTKDFWNRLKNGILIFQQTELPKDVRGLLVNSDFGSTSAIIVSVESDDRNYKSLEANVKEVEAQLRQVPGLAKISRIGALEEQLSVYVDNDKLLQYGLTTGHLMKALQQDGAIYPVGEIEGQILDKPIHLSALVNKEDEIANRIIKSDVQGGNAVRIKDIATIKREYDKPDSYITTNGKNSILLSMEMTTGKNIVQFGEAIQAKLTEAQQGLPADIRMSSLANQPEVVDHSITHFMTEFCFALTGVIIVTMLFLPMRIAVVAATTIPITIACTLGIMHLFGFELNTVTLAALIIVLGIVVDDPIVVIDNHVEQLDHGYSVWESAKKSAIELFPSVFTATLAIIATFTPLMFFMEGTSKDFVSVFPIVIIISLSLSLIISMLIVPYFNTIFIKTGLHQAEQTTKKRSMLDRIQELFNKHIGRAISYPKITLGIGLMAIVGGIALTTQVAMELFPKVQRNQFAMEVYLPNGYTLSQTDEVVKAVEKELKKEKKVVSFASFIGTSSPRFHTVYAPNLAAKNYAQILVNTVDDDATEELLRRYQKELGNKYPTAYVRMKQLDMVSSPAPIEVRLTGQSITALEQVADQVLKIAKKHSQVTWARTDFEEPLQSIDFTINQEEASRLGISREDLSNFIAMHMNGINATQVWEGDYALNVQLKSMAYYQNDLTKLMALNIPVEATNSLVSLQQLVTAKEVWNPGQIVRRNGERTMTVRMDITFDDVASEVLASMDSELQAIVLPKGVRLSYGGEHELFNENSGAMAMSIGMSVIVIFLILLWHFKHLKHAIVSFTTMPLSILGAAVGLILLDYAFSFTAFIGLLALCGIVVRNGIILIDFAEELRHKEGMTVLEAAIHASERRMRPIFLTSTAAAVGVIPMILSRSTLWGPLGTVICFGLLFSMVLTLFVLPTLYWVFFKNEDRDLKNNELENASSNTLI